MRTRVWVGIIDAIIFILGFFGATGSMFARSPYTDLYTAMMIIGALMVLLIKFVSWLEK